MSTSSRRGIGVSQGSAAGPVVQVRPPAEAPKGEPAADDVDLAKARIVEVLAEVADSLQARAQLADETGAKILGATALMARDKGLVKAAGKQLDQGVGPATALTAAVEEYCAMFEAAGGYLAERVTDLRDVRDRGVARLLGLPEPGVPHLSEPSVIVAHDLAPAETATLDPGRVLGIVTEGGGRTSHTAILAAQLGIPAVVQVEGATDIVAGTVVALDGDTGEVTIDPDDATRERLQGKAARKAAALADSSGPGRTRDGHPVALLANIGGVDDAVAAAAQDVEGVGLFRTEVVFLSSDTAPTVEEQTDLYRRVVAPFGDRRVVVRTLDAGADKPLAFADLGREENPALGRRGLRLGAARPELLDSQLEALGIVAREGSANLWVMAPMVATAEEAAWFARRCHENGISKVGVMIEIPAAAIRSRHVLAEVDFGSLGTNDLSQYTMAADRMQGELADLLDPWQPAVLDMVLAASEGAGATGGSMGVCGESAGDPLLALVLTGLGVSSLSMAPSKVSLVRYALARHDLSTCRAMAHAAREARTAAEAREAVAALATRELTDLL